MIKAAIVNWDAEWPAFLSGLQAEGQPGPTLGALEALVRRVAGAKLFTVMLYDAASRLAGRAYSSHPIDYPVGGAKPLSVGSWSHAILEERRPFVANTIEAIAEVFPDHELIRSLGCESVVNLPVVFDGNVIGTVNCLDVRGRYTQERVARLEALAPFMALGLLAARQRVTSAGG